MGKMSACKSRRRSRVLYRRRSYGGCAWPAFVNSDWFSLERGWLNLQVVNCFLNKIKTLAIASIKERKRRLVKIKYFRVSCELL